MAPSWFPLAPKPLREAWIWIQFPTELFPNSKSLDDPLGSFSAAEATVEVHRMTERVNRQIMTASCFGAGVFVLMASVGLSKFEQLAIDVPRSGPVDNTPSLISGLFVCQFVLLITVILLAVAALRLNRALIKLHRNARLGLIASSGLIWLSKIDLESQCDLDRSLSEPLEEVWRRSESGLRTLDPHLANCVTELIELSRVFPTTSISESSAQEERLSWLHQRLSESTIERFNHFGFRLLVATLVGVSILSVLLPWTILLRSIGATP